MEYRFLDPGPQQLIARSEMPEDGVVAVAVRTTGFDLERDEVVELALCDGRGALLFHQQVKPQNIEEWQPGRASGGLEPTDVADAPELYQFEDEISQIFASATTVVALHGAFAKEAIEGSWVTLPPSEIFDVTEHFCASHDTVSHGGEPAAAATLEGISAYYGLGPAPSTVVDEAARLAAIYKAYVLEHSRQRAEKTDEYWNAYFDLLRDQERKDGAALERERVQALKNARVNALLWLCAAAVFGNLAVQMAVRGGDASLVVMVVAVAVFFVYRWIRSLALMRRLHRAKPSLDAPKE